MTIDRDAPVSRSMSAMLAAIPGVLTLHEAERASRAVLDAILPEVQAQTLEDAATELGLDQYESYGCVLPDVDSALDWIRERAAEYRKAASE